MATYSPESEMALFHECTLQCAQKGLDTADIVRDGDLSPLETIAGGLDYFRLADHSSRAAAKNRVTRSWRSTGRICPSVRPARPTGALALTRIWVTLTAWRNPQQDNRTFGTPPALRG